MPARSIGNNNARVSGLYLSQLYYGCDTIIREFLALPQDLPLPLTIPHGVDFYRDAVVGDVHSFEPIYLAFREDLAENASKFKPALKFPHPWLFIIDEARRHAGEGTLFVAPPPSETNFRIMLARIREGAYPKPWGILLKDRGLVSTDFTWWTERGFEAHTAGDLLNPRFFYQLRDIFQHYRCVASPNMSSAVIFAVAMSRTALAIPDVPIQCVDVGNFQDLLDLEDADGKIKNCWLKLLAPDPEVARAEAESLLGKRYLDTPEALRARLLASMGDLDRQLHLYPLKNGFIYRVVLLLIGLGIPAHKLFPAPLTKIQQKVLTLMRLNRLTVYDGSDFSHYGVAGSAKRFEMRKFFSFQLGRSATPGFAVRK